jgi:hypothetical protein
MPAYRGGPSAFALLWPLPMSDRAQDAEILAPRHQLTVRQRRSARPCCNPQRTATQICAALARNLTHDEWNRYVPGLPYQRTCPSASSTSG